MTKSRPHKLNEIAAPKADRKGGSATGGGAKPVPVTGWRHIFAAASYSSGGLRRLWAETAFRHEVLIGALMIPTYFALGAQAIEFVIFAALFALLISVEALNTAIEVIIDRISPEWSEAGRQAKDLGSLAVMCVLIAHGVLLAWVVIG
ncbi:diacylglycerol kinase [Albirhodobacter sp. R86504]|uniref:diacylglycerol kinase n=1 Tax=Albirhodobacter sp. R86504 TaxID=3093848 RepID=UPI00366FFA23